MFKRWIRLSTGYTVSVVEESPTILASGRTFFVKAKDLIGGELVEEVRYGDLDVASSVKSLCDALMSDSGDVERVEGLVRAIREVVA